MDPIAAVGLASGILTFIDAGTKLIKTAYAIHNSLDGVLDDNRHREDVAGTVQDAASRLEITGILALTKEQQSLTDLAKRCKAISEHLLQLLEDIKPKGSSFKAFNAVRHAVKANKNKTRIGDLEGQLEDYRDQLSLALINISRVEAANGFSQLIFIAKNNETKLKSLIKAVEHLRQRQLSVQGPSPPKELQQLLVIDTTARHSMYQDFILNCLRFQGVHHRYEDVHTAHKDTFNWIYEPIEPVKYQFGKPYYKEVECQEMQIKSRDMFLSWLSSEVPSSPIFHISGKLGSGKSTLMKFLCSHQRTKEELTNWAGAKRLAFTFFFFWRNGSTAEKSLDGLCRSMLHCVLDERRDMIAKVLPIQWEEAERSPWKIQNRQEIPSREVQYALEKLLQDTRLYQHHKFCIFIDGLDEFEPGLQDGLDYVDLVGVLRRWARNANGNLKLCLSSREEPVFLEGFADAPSFRLQDLTRFDMQNYVRNRLNNLADDGLKDEMSIKIPERSSGIFLWIYLIVRSIRVKITHKATSETLRRYLGTLPQGLESLFHHILEQLEPDDIRRTLQLISCIQVANSLEFKLPLIAFSLLDNYSRDSNFSLRDGLEDETLPDESALQAQLWGASGGLIECCGEEGRKVMEFVHRSVPDMFHKDARNPDLTREMDVAMRGINCIDLMSHMLLAVVRLSISDPRFQDNQDKFREERAEACLDIAQARLIHRIDKPPYHFLEHIKPWIETVSLGVDSKVLLDIHKPHVYYMGISETPDTGIPDRDCMGKFFDLLCLAAIGDGGYIDWKISNDPSTLDDSVKGAMVGHSLLMSDNWEMFFRHSISTRDTTIPLLPVKYGYIKFDRSLSDDGWSLTVWQFFLINVILTRFSSPESPVNPISRFLREGADPYCRIIITKDGEEVIVTFCFRQAKCYRCRFSIFIINGFKDELNRCLALKGSPEIYWHPDPNEKFSPQEISFREWVAATDWDNRDSLLELLDCSYEEDRDS